MTEPVSKPTSRRILIYSIFGGILVALSIGSVLTTSHTNRQQQNLVGCGAQVVQQAINALKARDIAQIDINNATQVIVAARQEAYHALADAIEHSTITTRLTESLKIYDAAVSQYQTSISADTTAIRAAPLPTTDCLVRRQRQSAGVP